MRRCLLLTLLIPLISFAQERVITGRVTLSTDGSPLPGVNVLVKGTAIGGTTDSDGKYSVNVPENSTLVISYIGYVTQEILVGARATINVSLDEDATQLQEVVVTEMGIVRERRSLGYAVSSVDASQVNQKSESDPIRALQGKVAGLNIIGGGGAVGSGTNITIRGNSSLLGNNQPLMVVDGIPFDNTTYATGSFTSATTATSRSFDLDPNMIESATVLNGAAATARYGSRASNGAIVITTKSGAKSSKKGFEVSASTSYSVEKVSNLPDYQTQYTGGNNFLYVDGNSGSWGAPFDVDNPLWQIPDNANLVLSIDPATGQPWVPHPYRQYNDPDSHPYFPEFANDSILLAPHNNPKDFFQLGSLVETSISIRGGNEKAGLSFTASRTWNKGIVPGNELTRTNVSLGGNTMLENKLFLRGSLSYANVDMTSPPTTGLYNASVSVTERLLYLPPSLPLKSLPFEDATGYMAMYRTDSSNPYYLTRYAPNTSDVDRFFGNAELEYDLTDWLNVTYRAGFNGFVDRKLEVIPVSTPGFEQGQLTQDDIRFLELDAALLFTFNKDITNDLSFTGILGHNVNRRTKNRQAYQGTTLVVPRLNDLDNVQSVIPIGGGKEERAYQAVLADVTLGYKDWLFLNISGRNDWTSALPVKHRSYFYGGVSSSFIFTDALDIKSHILSSGKLRASFARVGSDPDPYLTQPINYFTNAGTGNNLAHLDYPYRGVNVQTVGNIQGNSEITPEFTTEVEVGTELKFLDNRVRLDFAYYERATTDQIVAITTSATSGYDSRVANIGRVSNKGIEVTLEATPVKMPNGLEWNILGVFSRNRNLVEELVEGLDEVFINGYGNDIRVVHRKGLPYGQILGTKAVRAPDGQLLVDPSSGKLMFEPEYGVIADPNPNFILGVTNTISWKGLSLSFLIDYKDGGQMYSATYNQVYGRGLTTGTIPDGPRGREVLLTIPGVQGDPNTLEPILDENGKLIPNSTLITANDWYFINTFGSAGMDEFSVFDASTIRLRELSIAYDIPVKWIQKTPFGSARISFTGRNLWYKAINFPEDLNFDPETSSLGSGNVDGLSPYQTGNAQGVDFGIIPTTKRYGVNVSVTF